MEESFDKNDYKKKEVLKKFLDLDMNTEQIGKVFGVTRGTVHHWIQKHELSGKNINGNMTYKNKEWLEKMYKEYNSATKIGKIANTSAKNITYWRKKFGIEKADSSQSARKYFYDFGYFNKIDTEEKAYWLGFIMADGHISNPDKKYVYKLMLGLARKDKGHLEKFQAVIGSQYEIYDKMNIGPSGKEYPSSNLAVNCSEICKDLMSHGVLCGTQKTYDSSIPKIKENLKRHYLRGLFDGDGTISYYNNRQNYTFEISTASCRLRDDLIAYFKSVLEINLSDSLYVREEGKKGYKHDFYTFKVMNLEKNLKIYKHLYDNASVFLDRKKEIVDKFLSKYCPAT